MLDLEKAKVNAESAIQALKETAVGDCRQDWVEEENAKLILDYIKCLEGEVARRNEVGDNNSAERLLSIMDGE
jgi:hypothetical protein